MTNLYYELTTAIWKEYFKNPIKQLIKNIKFLAVFAFFLLITVLIIVDMWFYLIKEPNLLLNIFIIILFLIFMILPLRVKFSNFQDVKKEIPILSLLNKHGVTTTEQINLLIEENDRVQKEKRQSLNSFMKQLKIIWGSVLLTLLLQMIIPVLNEVIKQGSGSQIVEMVADLILIAVNLSFFLLIINLIVSPIKKYRNDLILESLYTAKYMLLKYK